MLSCYLKVSRNFYCLYLGGEYVEIFGSFAGGPGGAAYSRYLHPVRTGFTSGGGAW